MALLVDIPWYVLLITLLIGAISTLLIQRGIREAVKRIRNKAPLIKVYWQFVIVFGIVCIVSYVIVLNVSSEDSVGTSLSVLNSALTIIFAVFVGYYAFMQVAESRVRKNAEKALHLIRANNYERAAIILDESYRVNPRDYEVLSNLLEIKLMLGDDEYFESHVHILKNIVVSQSESITCYFLDVARELFREYISEARNKIEDLIKHINKHPKALVNHLWDYNDMQSSDKYQQISGDTKTIFENVIKYLKRSLNADEKVSFEKGDYTLELFIKDQEQKRAEEEEKKMKQS